MLNIILRKSPSGGQFGLAGGGYMDGGGDSGNVIANIGFGGPRGSYLNVTAESRLHDRSDRGGVDPRAIDPARIASQPRILDAPGYPYVNRIQGDAKYTLHILSYNSGFSFGDASSFYSFGTYGRKNAQAYENYRTPDRLPAVYPFGFSPQEESKEEDFGVTAGLKGKVFTAWDWDVSTTYGRDDVRINTIDSANISLYNDTGSTPTDFHAGNFVASQWTTNFDVDREFEVGLASPLNVAIGIEHRHETYQIKVGDPESRYKEGSQSYPGFALSDAKAVSRDNEAVYVDFAVSPVEKLQLDIAGRFEHFSDFGDTSVGKITGRYDFTPAFALRGTFSTGFRAPTLAEAYYSATNVSPSSANVQLPPNSPAARLVGIEGLKPEDSTNYSLGVVLRPIDKLTMTLDAYQIAIQDRIVGSGSLCGTGCAINSPAVVAAIAANGNVLDPTVTSTGIAIFSNGLDTRTRGAELAISYPSDYSWGHVDWSLGANYNKTDVTSVNPTPAQLAPQVLYNATAISDLETASPKYRTVLGALWSFDRFTVSLKETLFGPSSRQQNLNGGPFFETRLGATPITDVEVAYEASSSSSVLARTMCSTGIPMARTASSWLCIRRPRTPVRWGFIRRFRHMESTVGTTTRGWSTTSDARSRPSIRLISTTDWTRRRGGRDSRSTKDEVRGDAMSRGTAPAIDIGIDAAARREIAEGLARVLADTYTLYLKTHAFHWNVEGPMFNTLHQMFMGQYTELWNSLDSMAERIRSLGFPAPGTYGEFGEAQLDRGDAGGA